MDTERMISELKSLEVKHRNDKVFTGQLNISEMAHDVRKRLEELKAYEDTGLTPEQIMELKERVNGGWIPVERELPPNAKYKGALCPRYQLDTKYGVTEGWYNPDLESWFVLVWFMTERYLNGEIDFENGAHPKIVRCENEVNEKHRIVLAWRPLPEPYRPERSDNNDGE